MNIVAFKTEHLSQLILQEAQQYFGQEIQREGYAQMLMQGPCFTALHDGEVIGCGGCVEIWENRAQAWMLIGQVAGRNMMGIHRAVNGFLLAAPWKRIEASVDVGFEPGQRWLELLGFYNETPQPMKAYRPNGGDSYLYARIKP